MSRREKSKRKRYLEILDTWLCSKKKTWCNAFTFTNYSSNKQKTHPQNVDITLTQQSRRCWRLLLLSQKICVSFCCAILNSRSCDRYHTHSRPSVLMAIADETERHKTPTECVGSFSLSLGFLLRHPTMKEEKREGEMKKGRTSAQMDEILERGEKGKREREFFFFFVCALNYISLVWGVWLFMRGEIRKREKYNVTHLEPHILQLCVLWKIEGEFCVLCFSSLLKNKGGHTRKYCY